MNSEIYELYTWGANSYGQLGLGHCVDVTEPQRLTNDDINFSNVKQINGGGGHVSILTDEGHIFTCGWNCKGQLGFESNANHVSRFRNISPFNHLKFSNLTCGWDFTVATTDDGLVYSWGSNSFGQLGLCSPRDVPHSFKPVLVEALVAHKVVSIAAGMRHVLAATDDGQVWSWGSGKYGQLGLKSNLESSSVHVPNKAQFLDDVKIKSVICGLEHSAALTYDGNLYVWGRNKKGQLAHDPSDDSVIWIPRLLVNYKFRHVWSGWSHFICLTDEDKIISWGRSDYGQLGRRHEECDPFGYCYEPSNVTDLSTISERDRVFVAVGSEHCLISLNDNIWSWGWNEHGNCGTGDDKNVSTPFQLRFDDKEVCVVGAGCGTSYLFVKKK